VEHLRTRGGLVTLAVHGKGFEGESRTLYLEPSTLAPLRHYLRERARLEKRVHLSPETPLFAVHGPRNRGGPLTTRALRHIVAERCEAVGVKTPRLTAHSFRHTAATEALRGGASNIDVKDMLGHASTATTDIYLHNLQREERRAERYVDLGLPQFEPRPVY
jgi:integrase/recombinase XerC